MAKEVYDITKNTTICPGYSVFPNQKSKQLLMGIYLPNGVMQESEASLGISYAVDGLLFEEISELDIEIKARTSYGFSEFLLLLPEESPVEILKKVLNVLFHPRFQPEMLLEWQNYMAAQLGNRDSFDVAYYRLRCPNSRLAKPVFGNAQSILAHKKADIEQWHHRFFRPEQLYMCLTGRITPECGKDLEHFLQQVQGHVSKNLVQTQCDRIVSADTIHTPTHYAGKTDLVISYPAEPNAEEIWNWEGICCALRAQLCNCLDVFHAELQGPLLILGPLSELRIHVQCPGKHVPGVAAQITHCIQNCVDTLDQAAVNKIRQEVADFYQALSNDLFEWNHFVGWNAVTGQWYDPRYLQSTLAKEITLEGMRKILLGWKETVSPKCFVIKA